MSPLKQLTDLSANTILLPPQSSSEQLRQVEKYLASTQGQLAITSSGTTGKQIKGFIFEKTALLANAKAVLRHLNIDMRNPEIRFGNSLPSHLIAGMSIYLRASLTANPNVYELGPCHEPDWWNKVIAHKISIISLVPRQLYQLVTQLKKSTSASKVAPPSLRYLLVGGDYLNPLLHQDALNLGLPIIRTYSMTEAGPQVASEKFPNSGLELLDIVQAQIGAKGELKLKSPSLFHTYFIWDESLQKFHFQTRPHDNDGFFTTQDLCEIHNGKLNFLGRSDGMIKLRGRLFSLQAAKRLALDYAYAHNYYGQLDLMLTRNAPNGPETFSLAAYVTEDLRPKAKEIEDSLRQLISPHHIDHFYWTKNIDTNDMGKTLWK